METSPTMKTVMYIGSKSRKDDRVNHDLQRVWTGPGSIVHGVPATQAAALCRHTDEFVDVTGLGDDELAKRASKARADVDIRKRSLSRTTGPGGEILLSHATEEELLKQLEKVRGIRGMADVDVPTAASPSSPELSAKQVTDGRFVKEKVDDALERIAARGNPADFDEDTGVPRLDVVMEEIGFNITLDEYYDALGDMAPARDAGNEDQDEDQE